MLIKSMLTSDLEFSPSSFPPVTVIRAALRPYKALKKVNATLSTTCTMQVLSIQCRKMLIDEQEWILLDKQCTLYSFQYEALHSAKMLQNKLSILLTLVYVSTALKIHISTTGGPGSPIIAF